MELFGSLKLKVVHRNIKIVFPEATDPRILGAAARLKSDELVEPVLIGDPTDTTNVAMAYEINTSNFIIINPNDYKKWNEMAKASVEHRNGKATKEDTEKILKDTNYFGTMLTYMGIADSVANGAIHSTGDTVHSALQIIKTRPDVNRTNDVFLIIRGYNQERYSFSGCTVNANLTAQELAEIAVNSTKTAELLDIGPKISSLSFSTESSAKVPEVTEVIEATKIVQKLAPEYVIDGELQFDVSYVPSVTQLKVPNLKVAGEAAVFVFPDLQSGNVDYEIAQRLGSFEAIGPILQGSNRPVSDLSRSVNGEDVYKLSVITAVQTLMND